MTDDKFTSDKRRREGEESFEEFGLEMCVWVGYAAALAPPFFYFPRRGY